MKGIIAAVSIAIAAWHASATVSVDARPSLNAYSQDCSGASPRIVVRAYYQALNQHRAAAAKACLTPAYLARLSDVIDPDWQNVVSARIVDLRTQDVRLAALPIDIRPLPYRAVQVGAAVFMHYRRIESSSDGLNVWFIYVIKQQRHSRWRIADIGSGP